VRAALIVLQSTAVGGMETHARYHAAELRRRGVRVEVVVPEAAQFDGLAAAIEADGVPVLRLDTDARRGRLPQLVRSLRLLRIVHSLRADVVHLHTGGATGGLLVVAAVRLGSRATVVVTEHDVPAPAPASWDRRMRQAMDGLTDCLVAVSRRNASLRLDRLGPPVRAGLAAVLNGVPIPTLADGEVASHRCDVRRQLGIPEGALVIGSLVRLAPGKGLTDLLPAFAGMRASGAYLLLVGDGPLRGELEELARELGVGDRVVFAGHRPAPAAYVDAMDAFVLAVPAGSMSIALLEVMARGVPSVITFCGPEEAVVDDRTGLCAPPNDPAGLGAVLDRLAADPALRRRLGEAGAAYVAERFSVARVADDLLAAYGVRKAPLPERLRVSA
jgi:glycosyltransferase involved in cell wall biosynthesis